MNAIEQAGLYLGAIYMDWDSDEVDEILRAAGLDPAACTLAQAKAALAAHDRLRFAYGVETIRQQLKGHE